MFRKSYYIFYSFIIIIFIYSIYLKTNCRYYVMLSSYGDYNIFLPLITHFWNMLRITPIITIVYNQKFKSIPFIYTKLKKEGAIVILKYISNKSRLDYHSRIDRIFNFLRFEDKNGIYITSDADMIPINRKFFETINYNMFNIKSFGLSGYGSGKANKRWPMCYFISKYAIWKEILELENNTTKINVNKHENNLISKLLQKGEDYYDGSFHRLDEIYMRDKIRKFKNFPHNVILHKRNFQKTRVKKEDWKNLPQNVNWSNIYDIHIPTHLRDYSRIWYEIQKLLKFYNINGYDKKYFNDYFSLKSVL